MDKKSLSERDICSKYIAPAVQQAGWDMHKQVREEVSFTKGRIIVRGNPVTQNSAHPPTAHRTTPHRRQSRSANGPLRPTENPPNPGRQLNEQLASTLVEQAVA